MCKKKKIVIFSSSWLFYPSAASQSFSCLSLKLSINQVVLDREKEGNKPKTKDSEIQTVREDSKTVRGK